MDKQIATTNNRLPVGGAQNKIELAIQGVQFNSIPVGEQNALILGLIQKAQIKSGQTNKDETFNAITATEIITDLLESYKWITCEELSLIFAEGVKSMYGDYMGINYKSIIGWIDGYRGLQLRKIALNKALATDTLEVLPPEAVEAKMKNLVMQVFHEYKLTDNKSIISYPIYNYLESKKLLLLSPEEKKGLMEDAKQELKEIHRMKKSGMDISKALQSITEGQKDDEIVLIAKRLAVRNFFDNTDTLNL